MISGPIELTAEDTAIQVANLLNKNNQLTHTYREVFVKENEHLFYESVFGQIITTCTIEWPLFPKKDIAKIKHLVTDEAYRNNGLGKKILTRALDNCKESVIILCAVRESNIKSLKTFYSVGFNYTTQIKGKNETLYLLTKNAEITKEQLVLLLTKGI